MSRFKKYTSEAVLDIAVENFRLLQANEIKEYPFKDESEDYNLYFIMSGERAKFKNVEISNQEIINLNFFYGKEEFTFSLNQKDLSEKPFTLNNFKMSKDFQSLDFVLFEDDLKYIQTTKNIPLEDKEQDGKFVINFKAHDIAKAYFVEHNKTLDFDLLYIGQSQNVGAISRLENHSKFQNILADCLANYPDKMIYVLLLNIQKPQVMIGIDGTSKDVFVSEEQDIEHLTKLIQNIQQTTSFKEIVNIAEALLIYHFKPKYNERLKSEFPNKNSIGYQNYITCDYHQVKFEFMQYNIFFPQLRFNTKTKSFSSGCITYSLHNDKNRQSIFDIFDKEIES